MNHHDRRRARRLLKCSSVRREYPSLFGPPRVYGHAPEDCDGSCHTRADLDAFDENRLLHGRAAEIRLEFLTQAMYPYAELEDEPELVRKITAFLVFMAAHNRSVAAAVWRLFAAFLTLVRRPAALARLVFLARLRRRQVRPPRLWACLDHLIAAPRTGPPAGRGGLSCHGGVLTSP